MADLQNIPLDQLHPHPDNPRIGLRVDVVERLTAEITANGFGPEHAVLARPYGDGWQLVSGHHRAEAARRAGLAEVPTWVREMDDDEAFMLLVLENTQGELTRIERAIHVYRYGERGERGRGKKGGLSEYARRIDRAQPRVSEDYAVGELVENHRTCDSFTDLLTMEREPYRQLLEISKAAPAVHSVLVDTLVKHSWTVADTRHHVQQIKAFDIPAEWEFWLPIRDVITAHLDTREFSPRTVAKLIAAAEQTTAWIDANAADPDTARTEFRTWLESNKGGKSWQPRSVAEYLQTLIASQFEPVKGWFCGDWHQVMHDRETHPDGALGDGTVGLLLTDPPYGQGFQSDYRLDRRADHKHEPITSDATPEQAKKLLADCLEAMLPKLADNAHVLVFCSPAGESGMRAVIEDAGLRIRGSLVWDKQATGMGDPDTTFAPAHERIIHAVKGSPLLYRRAADVLRHRRCDSTRHPTEKPVPLLRELIEATTAEGQLVADPFGGVASVPVAAKEAGRRWWGCEIEAKYHAAGEERLS